MQELRFVAVSEDGQFAVLAVPGRSARFTLPIDERLRAVALGQSSRLAQYEIEVESPLRPKEIQARIRAGETVEEIADAAGIAVERVRWFEGPVLAERAYMADQAQSASVRRQGDATPGPRLGEIVTERLKVFGTDPEDAQWDAKKLGDGSWQVQLTFIAGDRLHAAEWIFDPRRRHVLPADDNAARMSLPGTQPPQPTAPAPGEATVTRLAPRLSTAAGVAPSVPGTPPPSPATVAARVPRAAPGTQPARVPQPGRASQSASAPQPARHAEQAQDARVAQPRADRGAPPRGDRVAQSREETTAAAAPSGTTGSGTAARPPADDSPAATTSPTVHVAPSPSEAAAPAADSDPAEPGDEPGDEPGTRQGRKAARNRRSSVPSWDEIMFGNSRQRD